MRRPFLICPNGALFVPAEEYCRMRLSSLCTGANTLIKQKIKFSSYIRKFRVEHMRRPLVIYDFATAPLWISLYMKKIWFLFYQCSKYKKTRNPFEKYNNDLSFILFDFSSVVEDYTSPGSLTALLAVGAGEACAGPLVVRALLGDGVDALPTDAHRLRALHHLAVLVLLAHVHWAIWHGLTVRVDLCLRAEFFSLSLQK